jgi:protocatechuate 4,5-dioxygenase beta chain
VGRALEAWPEDVRVLVLGTGGLSHQLDGTRAGFINKAFDLMCMERIVDEPESLTKYTSVELVREAGVQGVEFINWLAARGALTGRVKCVHSNYHIPVSNTAAGLMVLENQSQPAIQARAA